MPLTKSATKKARVDKRRTVANLSAKGSFKTAIKDARSNPSLDTLKKLYSAMDKAVKHNLVAKGHASRLKSRISKLSKKK
jgi:ribosomal protein S20